MGLHLQPLRGHPDRMAHPFLTVDDEGPRDVVENPAVRGEDNHAGRLGGALHVCVRDLLFALRDRHHAAAIERSDVVAGDAQIDGADVDAAHPLGLADGLLDGAHRAIDINDDPLSKAGGRRHPDPENVNPTLRRELTNDGADFRGADVETNNDLTSDHERAFSPAVVGE